MPRINETIAPIGNEKKNTAIASHATTNTSFVWPSMKIDANRAAVAKIIPISIANSNMFPALRSLPNRCGDLGSVFSCSAVGKYFLQNVPQNSRKNLRHPSLLIILLTSKRQKIQPSQIHQTMTSMHRSQASGPMIDYAASAAYPPDAVLPSSSPRSGWTLPPVLSAIFRAYKTCRPALPRKTAASLRTMTFLVDFYRDYERSSYFIPHFQFFNPTKSQANTTIDTASIPILAYFTQKVNRYTVAGSLFGIEASYKKRLPLQR